MEAVYQKLVEVRLWHEYFLDPGETGLPALQPRGYRVSDFMKVVPPPGMEDRMRRLRFFLRTTDLGFDIIAEIRPLTPPRSFFSLRDPIKLTFFLVPTDPYFLNYTSLPLSGSANGIYYFNNLSNNTLAGDGALYLSQSLPAYDATLTYEVGDQVYTNGRVYEVTNVPVTEAPDDLSDQWQGGKNTQYVSISDQVERKTRFLEYTEPNNAVFQGQEVRFVVKDVFGIPRRLGFRDIPGLEAPMPIEQATFPDDPAQALVHKLDLKVLPTGYYTLELGNDSLGFRQVGRFFKNEDRAFQGAWGVVELIHIPPGTKAAVSVPSAFAFIDGGTAPNDIRSDVSPKTFTLALKNRITYWRFLSASDKSMIGDELGPFPLSKTFRMLTVDGNAAPNATPRFLNRSLTADGRLEKLYSNIYISN